ncbi:MAG: hypothetical protein M5U28_26910 [Sandaracinaceae bacterium]|nr:hypothetical protein [Sandaracinaceae bacterium]
MRTTMLACLLMTAIWIPGRASACDSLCTEQRAAPERRHAWGTFFGQTGFALAAGVAVPVLDSTGWNGSRSETGVVVLLPVLTGLGSVMGLVAEEGRWDPALGWALAGTWPGATLGVTLGVASALAAAPGDTDALHAGIAGGAAAGVLLGALAWYAEHADGGRPGALTGGFWSGYFTGLLVGLGAYAMGDGVAADVAPLAASAVGAIFGVLVAELLRTASG